MVQPERVLRRVVDRIRLLETHSQAKGGRPAEERPLGLHGIAQEAPVGEGTDSLVRIVVVAGGKVDRKEIVRVPDADAGDIVHL